MRLKFIPSPPCIGCGDAVPAVNTHCAVCTRAISALETASETVGIKARSVACNRGVYMIYTPSASAIMTIGPQDADWLAVLQGRVEDAVRRLLDKAAA